METADVQGERRLHAEKRYIGHTAADEAARELAGCSRAAGAPESEEREVETNHAKSVQSEVPAADPRAAAQIQRPAWL